MRVDLHLHTNASDGQYTPTELVELAQKFDVIAITDHDTTAGVGEAQRAAQMFGSPVVIPGIELSCEDDDGDVHVLGYFVDIGNAEFQVTLANFRNDRFTRGQRIVEKLAALNLPLDWERVLAIANGGAIGRPHIARAMLEKGYVESVKDAFNRYIGSDGPAYVARKRLSPEEAVALIHSASGVAVLGHPGLLKDYRAILQRLIAVGLDGVEVAHPANTDHVRLDLRAIAMEHHLIMTGGSDFHGPKVKPDNILGMVTPPESAVEALRERARHYAAG